MPKSTILFVVAVVGLGSCATSSPEPTQAPVAAEPSAPEVTLAFGWPIPSSAQVTEEVKRHDGTGITTYRVELTRIDDGYALAHKDFRFLELDGEKIDTPEEMAELAPLVKQAMSGMPDMLVDDSGRYKGITNIDKLIELSLAAQDGDVTDEARAAARAHMNDPRTKAMLERRIGNIWDGWVGAFVGQKLTPNKPHVVEDAQAKRTYTITTDGENAHVRLDITVNPELVKKSVTGQMQAMHARLGKTDPLPPIHEVSRTAVLEAELDVKTLRPTRAVRSERTYVRVGDEPGQERVEEHIYVFAWE